MAPLPHSVRRLIVLQIFAACFCACQSCGFCEKVRRASAFYKKEFILPDTLIQVKNGSAIKCPFSRNLDKPLYVIYIGPQMCSSCIIPKLGLYDFYFSLSEESGYFEPIVIFANGSKSLKDEITHFSQIKGWDFPVFIDYMNEIDSSHQIPSEYLYSNFLIGVDGVPFSRIDPMNNAKSKEEFLRLCENSAYNY